MFQDLIRETPFMTEAAQSYFTNIQGDSWNGDFTFLSTMRALLGKRIPEDEPICLTFRRASYGREYLDNYKPRECVGLIANDIASMHNRLYIVNICHSSEDVNNAWVELMREHFTTVFPDFTYLEKVTVFFRKICATACFVNAKTKTSIFFISQLTARRMHYIQRGFPAYLPWYFDPAMGITEDERSLLDSFREKSKNQYMQILTRIASGFDFEAARIRKLLCGFETKFDRVKLQQTKSAIEGVRRNIESLNRQIGDQLRAMRELDITVLGLDAKIKNGESSNDLMDYFLANKRLVLRSVSDTSLEFVVKATLDFFDEEQARKYIERNNSFFYDYIRSADGFTRDNIKMLMTEIFLTQRLKVNLCAAYHFDLHGSVQGLKNYEEYGSECDAYTPNPHIDRYRCLGNYEQLINQCLESYDYIGAVEQCVASCKSLNLSDSAVMGVFVERFCGGDTSVNMRCVVLPDGSVVTPADAIKWLNAEKKAKAEAEKRAAEEAAAASEEETPAEETPAEEAAEE